MSDVHETKPDTVEGTTPEVKVEETKVKTAPAEASTVTDAVCVFSLLRAQLRFTRLRGTPIYADQQD